MSQLPDIIRLFFNILIWLIFARVILSWLPHNRQNPVIHLLYEGTEPLLGPVRKILPKSSMPVDFSPLVTLILLQIIREAIIRLL